MTKHVSKLNRQRLEERGKIVSLFELPPVKPLTPELQEMISLYRDKGVSFKSIAKIQGLSGASVRRRLIECGVWKPDSRHQTKKGHGKAAGQNELRRLSRKTKKEVLKARRHQVAVCLWALRRGTGVETTCHANGWITSSVWNFLNRNRAYLRRKAKRTNAGSKELGQKKKWISRQYRVEGDFQDAVAKTLTDAGFAFKRERRFTHSRDRVDFDVGGVFVECKINAKPNSFHRAMGQAFQAKLLEGVRVCILVPDDVVVRGDQAEALQAGGISLTTHSGLLGVLHGNEGNEPSTPVYVRKLASHRVRSSSIRKRITCRCCMEKDKQPSMSPSGSRRSWCVDCDPIIHSKEYDYKRQQWVEKGWDA